MKNTIILGGGMVGRLAKLMFPEAIVLESKKKEDIYTAELGVCISIIPIPELKNIKYKRFIQIDGQRPTIELINSYKKKIEREGDMSYGDFRQFEPEQVVFKQELPRDLDIRYGTSVCAVNLLDKTINIGSLENRDILVPYDILISTIPLVHLIELSDLFSHFQESSFNFFKHRPIYILRVPWKTEDSIIRENYLTDPNIPFYRENYFEGYCNRESLFKVPDSIKIYPGKIYPNENTVKILEDLQSFKVYCVGRYAQWDNHIHLWNAYSKLELLKEVVK